MANILLGWELGRAGRLKSLAQRHADFDAGRQAETLADTLEALALKRA
jgi:hypothetical protein